MLGVCRWRAYPSWVMELWSRYTRVVKRGLTPIIHTTPDLYVCLEVELRAEAERARAQEQAKNNRDFVAQQMQGL